MSCTDCLQHIRDQTRQLVHCTLLRVFADDIMLILSIADDSMQPLSLADNSTLLQSLLRFVCHICTQSKNCGFYFTFRLAYLPGQRTTARRCLFGSMHDVTSLLTNHIANSHTRTANDEVSDAKRSRVMPCCILLWQSLLMPQQAQKFKTEFVEGSEGIMLYCHLYGAALH